MPRFPKRELEIQELAHRMVQGYTDNPTIFTNADIAGVQALLTDYETKKDDQDEKQAIAEIATGQKDIALHAMEVKMREQLKQSDVDVGANKDNLDLIGWGPRATPTPSTPPGQVRMLESVMQGAGTLKLDWKCPEAATGGPVRTYKVQRRVATGEGTFGPWEQAGIAFETEVFLSGQPQGIQMEYQVVGVNAAGEGVASNTIDVVL